MLELPFGQVWFLDFEFISKPGSIPVPVCMVARELNSGRLIRLWQDQFKRGMPPFPVDDDTLFVAFFASAEWGCFLELGWPVPTCILDLYAEFRNATNGLSLSVDRDLLGALSYHGIPSITKEQKTAERDLVLRGGPWTAAERLRILDYCQSDVDVLGPLLERMLPAITARPKGLGQGLQRGRYTAAVARMERSGVPIDTESLDRLRGNWDAAKLDFIEGIDKNYGVYQGTTFKRELFAAYLADNGIGWPRTPTGRLREDEDTFSDMAKCYPQLQPLKELRYSLSQLKLEGLHVGPDGRNRTLLSPFGARTGRNTPSNTKFIFGPSVWLRGLIKPPEGRAVAYVDWKSQEIYIAAQLSRDQTLLDVVQSGDPYLAFAKMAGLAPPDATKQSHPEVRAMCKTCFLGLDYGMQAPTLAMRTGLSLIEAEDLMRRMADTFSTFTAWSEQVVNSAQLKGYQSTRLGWAARISGNTRPQAMRNYPMQAHGAEVLRLACCLATERGVQVAAPVHDALLVEGDAAVIDDVVATTRAAMGEASRVVLRGLEIDTDVEKIVRWPDRYADERGVEMWEQVWDAVNRCEGRPGTSGTSDTSDTSDTSGTSSTSRTSR